MFTPKTKEEIKKEIAEKLLDFFQGGDVAPHQGALEALSDSIIDIIDEQHQFEIAQLKTALADARGETCMMCNWMERDICREQKEELRERLSKYEDV